MKLRAVKADITRLEVDAILNAANSSLLDDAALATCESELARLAGS